MRVHLLCDHKWRDLPNLVALKLLLERSGYQVLISTTKDAAAMISAFRPDCVVFNHLFASNNQELAKTLRDNGVAVVVLPTEGAVRPELRALASGEFAQEWSMDFFLAWGEQSAGDVRARWNMPEEAVPVTGCARFDFYAPRFRAAITSRSEFCRVHELDPEKPIVTWASAYAYAELDKNPAGRAKFLAEIEANGVAECNRRIKVDPADLPGYHAEGRRAALQAFAALAKARSDLQFIIRPHPVEPRAAYQEVIEKLDLRNVRFCPQDYIWNVLNAADVHLHRQCTTSVEAWIWKKPTVEMGMDRMEAHPWPDREAGSEIARDEGELIDIVGRYVERGARVGDALLEYRDRYVSEWFGPQDGRSCERAASAMHDLLVRRRPRKWISGIKGLPTTGTDTAKAVARYATARLPNQSLVRRQSSASIDPQDKQITRLDVSRYGRLIASVVD
jgi:surface carbohydrate biosynthesis protein